MVNKPHPTQETLREYFEYLDGCFIRKIRTGPTTQVGQIVKGFKSSKMIFMKFNDTNYGFHRLVWIYHHGDIPESYEIDHIDCNPHNNNIENLRLATKGENARNTRYQGNNSGYKDITKYSKIEKGKTYWYYLVGVKANGRVDRKNFPFTEAGLLKAIEYRDYQINKLHGEFGRLA